MKAAILHYHLGVGGVSTVVASQSRAMTRAGVPHLVFCGEPVEWIDERLPVVLVPEFGYQDTQNSGKNWELLAEQVVKRMRKASRKAIGADPEVWHAHNSTLARHPLLPHVVAQLAQSGQRLWIHVHDFAEDGRPQYLEKLGNWRNLYPHGPSIHYRFLNQRDRNRLISAGLPESCAKVISNPINERFFQMISDVGSPPETNQETTDSIRWMLYPVRGIRRKNLGEVLLFASQLPSGWRIAVTQAPKKQHAMRRYEAWQQLSEELGLPVEFSVVGRLPAKSGAKTEIDDWIMSAKIWLSTSIEEGFGMVFSEALALKKTLIGRSLPHLDCGKANGRLYEQILVPVDWVNREHLACWREQVWWALIQAHGNREQIPPRRAQEHLLAIEQAAAMEERVDFGNLPESLQERVLRHLRSVPEDANLVQVESWGQSVSLTQWLDGVISASIGHECESPSRLIDDLLSGDSSSKMLPDEHGKKTKHIESTNQVICSENQAHYEMHHSPSNHDWLSEDEFWQEILAAEREPISSTIAVTWLDPQIVLETCLWGSPSGGHKVKPTTSRSQPFHFLLAPSLLDGDFPDVGDADAVIFDVYGTLLRGLPGGVRQDAQLDPLLNQVLHELGYGKMNQLTAQLEREVRKLHAESSHLFPEIDLRNVWRKVLDLETPLEALEPLVVETEKVWHPVVPIPGAFEVVSELARRGCVLGLLSNAQCNTRYEMKPIFHCFHPNLTLFSYQQGSAKPGQEMFQELLARMRHMGIRPNRTWLVGNDPLQDIVPAANLGLRTAWFTGETHSLRRGWAVPTRRFGAWNCS